ncbi:transcription termination factor NusA [Spiroplasma endosymbiont of Anurida maritima]|uniref:transcription termination factor NusA n=1 Tax=Spiroplasma endosymbiont of Anurida maritima TaxID=2967972 RepID=UPI0036D211F5
MNTKQLLEAINDIVKEKQIEREVIITAIEDGFKKAYEKHFDPEAIIHVDVNEEAGTITCHKEIYVVDEVEDDLLEVTVEEAKEKYGVDKEVDDVILERIDESNFSRLAIIQVGQIIKQQIKQAEKESIYEELKDRKESMMHGIVTHAEQKYLLVEFERTFAYIPSSNLMYGDKFQEGDQIQFIAEDISNDKNAGQITGSRASNDFLLHVLQTEIPEIFEKIVTVHAISRDPGKRSKIAISSNDENIDPIGACVGKNGQRIASVSEKLNGEKIDISLYDEDPIKFIVNSFSPVKVLSVNIVNEEDKEVDVVVPDEQLSLSIGKRGMTAKLVVFLTGWRMNIINKTEAEERNIPIHWNGAIKENEYDSFIEELHKKTTYKNHINKE